MQNNMIGFVYLLRNPIDDAVFYVGQTVYQLHERLRGHLSEKGKGIKNKIISEIISHNLLPIIEQLESVEYNQNGINLLNERELFWIKHYSPPGNRLHVLVYIKKCANCEAVFEAKRERAMYCSDLCRASKRQKTNNDKVRVVNNSIKFEKNKNCEYCGKDLKAKYRSKRFCNDKCRIYYNRENVVAVVSENNKKENKVAIEEGRSTPRNLGEKHQSALPIDISDMEKQFQSLINTKKDGKH